MLLTCGCWEMGDDRLGVAAPVVSALLTVATAAELLLLAAEASPLIRVKRFVMTCDCDIFAIAATFVVMSSGSSPSLSLLLSLVALSFLVVADVPSVVVVRLHLLICILGAMLLIEAMSCGCDRMIFLCLLPLHSLHAKAT